MKELIKLKEEIVRRVKNFSGNDIEVCGITKTTYLIIRIKSDVITKRDVDAIVSAVKEFGNYKLDFWRVREGIMELEFVKSEEYEG